MEAGKILSADVLDIIFDTRNKEYGAYDLRKNYQRRLMKAVIITLLVALLICLTYVLMGNMTKDSGQLLLGPDVSLTKVEPPHPKTELPPPPALPKPPPPAVKTVILTPPIIVKEPAPEEVPPTVDALETAKIGTHNPDGADFTGEVGPPVAAAKGVVDEPKNLDADKEKIWYSVEIESAYPGGVTAWARFLGKNAQYTDEIADKGVQGTVVVQFIVDTEGNVSDVIAVSGPGELRKIAETAIRKSGKWEPAIQNGRKVKSYKKQPITFRLPDEQ